MIGRQVGRAEFRSIHKKHKLYHAAPGASVSILGCDVCKIILCSFCNKIDKRENRMSHNNCYSELRKKLLNQGWSKWFVRHRSGNGMRVKIKPSVNAVHGGAGSVSQMIKGRDGFDFQTSKVDNVSVIRFSMKFQKEYPHLIAIALSLDEWIEYKNRIPGQTKLEEYF